jgi:Zn-dependent M32 family carboxypeptidase
VGYFIGFTDTKEVEVRPEEIEEYARLPLDEVQDRLTFPDIKRLFEEIKETLQTLQSHAQN